MNTNMLMNKNGIEINFSGKEIFEELMHGTGCVMAEQISIFLESVNIAEKFIIVSRVSVDERPAETIRFPSGQFKEAYELFSKWLESS